MKIKNVYLSKSYTGFYFDDQKAIKQGASHDGFFYEGKAVTDGFTNIRQPGEAISVQLELEDGQVAKGDCCAVQYSGAGGRDPVFLAKDFIPFIEKNLVKELVGLDITEFKANAERFDSMKVDGKLLHTAIRYGITQALLDAAALANKCTRAEVINKEYKPGVEIQELPIFTQSGDDRETNADKMIIKEAQILPHALINNVETKLGKDGSILKNYITWLSNRITSKRANKDYSPIFHIDVYGTIGNAFDHDVTKMADYLATLEEAAKPFHLRIEGPVDTGERESQIKLMAELTAEVDKRGINVEIVADEWCNTLQDIKDFADAKAGHVAQIKTPDLGGVNNIADAVIYCNSKNFGSYVGGTCNETNVSAETTTNIAMACGALQVLAKPGMGVDEGFMIVKNEMNRVLARVKK